MTDLTEAAAAVRRRHPIYRNRNTGVTWQVELESGDSVWLRDIVGHTQQRQLDELQNRETWERVACQHELSARGEQLPQAKLNEIIVRQIRENRRGLTARQWAEQLGVHQRTIDKVRDYRSWRHV